ncbi:MAG TPA: heavy metal-binding domain-containing protein [Mucilaginibacter sp.]
MKRSIILIAIAGCLTGFGACSHPAEKAAGDKENKKKPGKYFCTMHPSVSSDTPGVCPKCGMEMVERDTTVKK